MFCTFLRTFPIFRVIFGSASEFCLILKKVDTFRN